MDRSRDDDPDWSLLPMNPTGFFGLDSGFDRRDLKRSYNRLLRRFKPEKHPEEFQRIRAAYEDLERRLRYGQPTAPLMWERPAPSAPDAERPAESPAESPDRSPGEPAAVSFSPDALAERVEGSDESLAELYRQLRNRSERTPFDYYSLALLADVVETGDDLWFLRWLLEGLKAWPGDAGISRLVYGFLGQQVSAADLPRVLVACSKAVGGDEFFALTEGGWDRLLRAQSIATFLDTLRRCESNLSSAGSDGANSGRVAFYIHALRFAMWRDPTEWKNEALEYVEEHFDQAPPHLENDLDLLGLVRDYLRVRDRFVRTHDHCRRIDAVLETVFTSDPVVADQELIDCQLEMLGDPEGIREAFPASEHEIHIAMYPLWACVTGDAAARLADQPTNEPDYDLWRNSVRGVLRRFDDRLNRSATGAQWNFAAHAYGALKYVGLIVASVFSALAVLFATDGVDALAADRGAAPVVGVLAVLIPIALAVFGYVCILPMLDRRVWSVYCAKMAERCYRRVWRPDLLTLLDRSMLDYFVLRALIDEAADQFKTSSWVSQYVSQDGALAVYSLAQRFRH